MIAMIAAVGTISCENVGGGTDVDQRVDVVAMLENGREWNTGDEVLINGGTYLISEGGKSTVTITDVPKAESYCGAYDFGSGSVEGSVLSFNLPAMQGANATQPMVASNTTPNLVFKNVLGTLNLNVKGEGTITRAVLTSTEAYLAGTASVNLNFVGAPSLSIEGDGSYALTADLGEGVTLPATIGFSLPTKYYSGFVVTLYGANNEVMAGAQVSAVEVRRGESVEREVTFSANNETTTYITASVEKDAEGNTALWGASSVLYVNGVPATLVGGANSANGEFGPVTEADVYYVSTSSDSANGVSGSTMRISIPTTQRNTTALSAINPAVAKATTNSVELSYLAGVLNIEVSGPHILRRATLSGKENRRLAGAGVVDMSTSTPRLALGSDASKSVVADFGTAGLNIESGASLRFVIPAENYTEGFALALESTAGLTYTFDLNGVEVERNKVAVYPGVEWAGSQNDSNDLSKFGYANCYMVHAEGDYTFRTRKIDNTNINNIAKVDWLWVSKVEGQSGNALVSNIKYENGVVSFTASANEGNALLAAFDASGNIVWSWHIWMTDKPEVHDYQNNFIEQSGGQTNGYYCMDRNLGATDATALGGYETFGLYYQWGRKDPFIGDKKEERSRDTEAGGWKNNTTPFGNSGDLTVCNTEYAQAQWLSTATTNEKGTIEYASAHPMTFFHSGTGSQPNWRAKSTLTSDELYDKDKSLWRPFQKSVYDPCPVGYQVPRAGMWVCLVSANCVHTEYKGFVHTTDLGDQAYYPSAGYRSAHPSDSGSLISVQNDSGFVKMWSSEMVASELSSCFTFNYPLYFGGESSQAGWGNGYNVRCVKEY